MKQNKTLWWLASLIILCFVGCNLFSFTNPTNSTTDYLAEGQKKYWDGDFAGAVEDFTRAIDEDLDNADAYWWHAKALLRATGNTSISLITMLSGLETRDSTLLPFMDWPADKANTLYRAMFGIDRDLVMIYDDSVHSEELDADAVALDYAASLSILGTLMLRDTNVDSFINEEDINLLAFFQDGEFIIPDSLWDLEDIDQDALIEQVIVILENFEQVVELLGEDIEGIEIDSLSGIVDSIIVVLDSLGGE